MTDDRPLRVAQLITTLARGGAQATVLASRQMNEHGVDVTILAGPDNPGEGTHWPDLASAEGRVIEVPSLRRSLNPVADLRTLWWLVRWLRSPEGPDVLHTHSSKAGVLGRLAARVAGVPVVHTVHGWSFAAPGHAGLPRRLIGRTVITLERVLANVSRALVVVTPLDAEQGLVNGIGRSDQYRLVRSGVDLDKPLAARERRTALRRQLGLENRFVVGTVGRLAAQKDIGTLLDGFALAARSDESFADAAVLVIVGDGPDRRVLEARADKAGIGYRTMFLGQRSDAAELVAAFDTFVLTSRWEGLPRTLVEAMAASVPVVATPVGGIPELVRAGETGLIVAPGDTAGVAEAVRRLRDDPLYAEGLADCATEAVAEFSADRMRHDLGSLWADIALSSR